MLIEIMFKTSLCYFLPWPSWMLEIHIVGEHEFVLHSHMIATDQSQKRKDGGHVYSLD